LYFGNGNEPKIPAPRYKILIMIGYLKGTIIDKEKDSVLLDCNGVGYKVKIKGLKDYSEQSEGRNKELGANDKSNTEVSRKVGFFIHTHVREDEISLYGFSTKEELYLFEMLISVSGVGPKVALAILSASKSDRIISAISKADVDFFTTIPGIGKKGAQKIIIELKNKVGSITEIDLGEDGHTDLVDGLTGMGFAKYDVIKVVRLLDPELSEEEKIKEAIRKLGKISNF
jgi:holliday junction DNA helicase RuvA